MCKPFFLVTFPNEVDRVQKEGETITLLGQIESCPGWVIRPVEKGLGMRHQPKEATR